MHVLSRQLDDQCSSLSPPITLQKTNFPIGIHDQKVTSEKEPQPVDKSIKKYPMGLFYVSYVLVVGAMFLKFPIHSLIIGIVCLVLSVTMICRSQKPFVEPVFEVDLDEDDSCSLVGRNAQQQEFDYDFFDFENARINSNLGQQKAILEINN